MSEEYEPGLVSVIIPTYNRAHFLVEAMDSVWEQTYRPIELIVVDDGSTDNSKQVLEEWGKTHADDEQFELRYFYQENKGAPAARNLGLIESRGEYTVLHDSDDIMLSERIESSVRQSTAGAFDLCFSAFQFVRQTGQRVGKSFRMSLLTGDSIRDFVEGRLRQCTSAWLFRRTLLIKARGFDESLPCYQDYSLLSNIVLLRPRIGVVNSTHILRRRPEDNNVSGLLFTERGLRSYARIQRGFLTRLKERHIDPQILESAAQATLNWSVMCYRKNRSVSNELFRLAHHYAPGLGWGDNCLDRTIWWLGGRAACSAYHLMRKTARRCLRYIGLGGI